MMKMRLKSIARAPFTNTPLYYALENFLSNVNDVDAAIEDFNATYSTSDKAALIKYLGELKRQPTAGWKEGLASTIAVLKANEAVLKRQKVTFQKEWFELT